MSVDGLWAWGAKLWVGARAPIFIVSALLILAACGSGDGRKRAVECQSDDDCDTSTLGVCDTVSCIENRCEVDTLPDGHRCNDDDPQTKKDACLSGICAGVVMTCDDDLGPCLKAVHDPVTDECTVEPVEDGVSCDDADACTQIDACQAGECVGGEAKACTAVDDCHVDGECDPKTGECSDVKAEDGAPCDDAQACTTDDACQDGVCAGQAVNCDDGLGCSVDSCDEKSGACAADMTACSCVTDADCSDGNACNGQEVCGIDDKLCKRGTVIACPSSTNPCQSNVCVAETGACELVSVQDGTACDDANACTARDTCQSGACVGSDAVVCAPLSQCHVAGTCNPTTGTCSNPERANDTSCNDNNACTVTDKCQAGACVGTAPVVCAASDQCHTAGTCDTSSGICSNPAKANGSTCDDNALCTKPDTCQGGVCTGSAVTCTAIDQCHTAGTCDPKTGGCSNPAKTDGTRCDDGTSCTLSDTCQLGVCGGTKRANLKGDWADDPGNLATSVDIFTDGKNNAHIAGTYTATLRFNDKDTKVFTQLGLPTAYVSGIYWTVYTEAGVVASALNIGGVGTDVQGLPGTLTVVDAAGNKDGTFTLLGTFSGPATFGASSKIAPPIALNIPTKTVFVARFAADGTILWVAPLLSDAKSDYNVGSLAAYDDGSVIASGTMTVGTTFYGAGAKAFAFDDRAGVWAARLGADGAGQWASIVVTPGQSGGQVVGSVTTHEDGGATLSGRFTGNVLLGPKSEISVSTSGVRGDIDVWYLKLDKAGAKLWGGRVGGAGGDWGGDVARIQGGGALLMVNTLGAAVNGSDAKTTQPFLATATTGLQTHIIGIDAAGVMQTDALIANPTAGVTRGWQLKRDLAGLYAVAGTFQAGTSFYSSVGFGTGAPVNAPNFTVKTQGQGPLTLFVARVDASSKFGWATQAGGDGSGMATNPPDLVMTAHASHSITLAGLFSANAVFGDQVQEGLTVAAGGTGNPFVVHLNSQEEYDYCP